MWCRGLFLMSWQQFLILIIFGSLLWPIFILVYSILWNNGGDHVNKWNFPFRKRLNRKRSGIFLGMGDELERYTNKLYFFFMIMNLIWSDCIDEFRRPTNRNANYLKRNASENNATRWLILVMKCPFLI